MDRAKNSFILCFEKNNNGVSQKRERCGRRRRKRRCRRTSQPHVLRFLSVCVEASRENNGQILFYHPRGMKFHCCRCRTTTTSGVDDIVVMRIFNGRGGRGVIRKKITESTRGMRARNEIKKKQEQKFCYE